MLPHFGNVASSVTFSHSLPFSFKTVSAFTTIDKAIVVNLPFNILSLRLSTALIGGKIQRLMVHGVASRLVYSGHEFQKAKGGRGGCLGKGQGLVVMGRIAV